MICTFFAKNMDSASAHSSPLSSPSLSTSVSPSSSSLHSSSEDHLQSHLHSQPSHKNAPKWRRFLDPKNAVFKYVLSGIALTVLVSGVAVASVLAQIKQDNQSHASTCANYCGGCVAECNVKPDVCARYLANNCGKGTPVAQGNPAPVNTGGNNTGTATAGSCPSGWLCTSKGVTHCADTNTVNMFNGTWDNGQAEWMYEAGCGGSQQKPKSTTTAPVATPVSGAALPNGAGVAGSGATCTGGNQYCKHVGDILSYGTSNLTCQCQADTGGACQCVPYGAKLSCSDLKSPADCAKSIGDHCQWDANVCHEKGTPVNQCLFSCIDPATVDTSLWTTVPGTCSGGQVCATHKTGANGCPAGTTASVPAAGSGATTVSCICPTGSIFHQGDTPPTGCFPAAGGTGNGGCTQGTFHTPDYTSQTTPYCQCASGKTYKPGDTPPAGCESSSGTADCPIGSISQNIRVVTVNTTVCQCLSDPSIEFASGSKDLSDACKIAIAKNNIQSAANDINTGIAQIAVQNSVNQVVNALPGSGTNGTSASCQSYGMLETIPGARAPMVITDCVCLADTNIHYNVGAASPACLSAGIGHPAPNVPQQQPLPAGNTLSQISQVVTAASCQLQGLVYQNGACITYRQVNCNQGDSGSCGGLSCNKTDRRSCGSDGHWGECFTSNTCLSKDDPALTNRDACGFQGIKCPADQFCSAGTCTPYQGTSCNLPADSLSGGCGNYGCDSSSIRTCSNGKWGSCQTDNGCLSGNDQRLRNHDYCGVQNQNCGANGYCVSGVCRANTDTHCGQSGANCANEGSVCASGVCKQTIENFCGQQRIVCPTGNACGYIDSSAADGYTCVDLSSNYWNCGRVGNKCPDLQYCSQGRCTPEPHQDNNCVDYTGGIHFCANVGGFCKANNDKSSDYGCFQHCGTPDTLCDLSNGETCFNGSCVQKKDLVTIQRTIDQIQSGIKQVQGSLFSGSSVIAGGGSLGT